MMHPVELTNLTSGYSGVPVVRQIDLHVAAGEVVALLGGNGAGKTTTLLTLAGVLKPIDGEARVLGEPVKAGKPHHQARNGVVLVPDDRSVFANLTCRENLQLARTSRRDWSKTQDLVLSYFPALAPKLNVAAGLLSGGEQQMLAVGRAMASRPRVLMIDELSLGLAPLVVADMLPTIRTIAAELDTAVLLVEQHVDLVLAHSDRAYVLNHGRITLAGESADLLANKAQLRASYLHDEEAVQ